MPKAEKCRLLRRVFDRASERDQQMERSRYQRQYDVLKARFDLWKSKVEEKNELIQQYMALSHYRVTLLVKSFKALKSVTQKNLACHVLTSLFLR